MDPAGTRVHTFVVRIWLEPSRAQKDHCEWRGEVKHVLTGDVAYFRPLEELVNTIKKLRDAAGDCDRGRTRDAALP